MLRVNGMIEAIDNHKITINLPNVDIICEYVGLITKIKITNRLTLYIYPHIKETVNLYAFSDEQTLFLFKALLKVKNVSYAIAASVLQKYDYQQVELLIINKDIEKLMKIPKIGFNTASNIIKKMKVEFTKNNDIEQILPYLLSLGYERQAILNSYQQIDSQLSIEDKIIKILKIL